MSREPHAATIGRELQGEPTDPRALAVVSDHDDGRMLAQWLSASGAGWRTWADRIAGHVVSLGIAPNGRARALAEDVPWNWVPPPGAWMATRRAGWSGIVWPKSRAGRAADDLSLVLQRLCGSWSACAPARWSVALRFEIFYAGMESSGEPNYTVVPQRRRTSEACSVGGLHSGAAKDDTTTSDAGR